MRRTDPKRAVLYFWSDLTFHEAALLAEEDAKHLVPVVTQSIEDFYKILKLDLDTRRAILQASAQASIADINLDGGIRGLYNAALFLAGQDRKRAEFSTLFSGPISAVIRYALKRQLEVAEEIVQKLGLKIYTDEFRSPHLAKLSALITKGKSIVAAKRTAEFNRTEARLDIRAWKDDANAVRLANYGELLAIAAKTGRGKDWAEAFFLSPSTGPTEIEDEAPVEGESESDPSAS